MKKEQRRMGNDREDDNGGAKGERVRKKKKA